MEIRLAEAADRLLWDRYVDAHPEGTPYHLYGWKEAVEKAYGHVGYYLTAEDGGEIKGVLPLVLMRSPIRRTLVSLPFCDLGASLTDDDQTRLALLDRAGLIARQLRLSSIELRSPKGEPGGSKVRMLLSLPENSQALWKGLPSKLRSQVRKAEKNGLSFSWGGRNDVDSFYQIFSRNMRDLGSPVHSKQWIEAVLREYEKRCRLALVFKGDEAIAGGIVLYTSNAISIPWASTIRDYNRLAPNMLLYWKLLEFAADQGFRSFDFGRSTIGEGTYKFKKQWGTTPEPLNWQLLGKGSLSESTGTTSRKRKLAAAAWSRLPIELANWLGPRFRRHISL